jgi:hypothetical protein
MADAHLFDPRPFEPDGFELGPSTDKDSYTKRLTRRRRALLAQDTHPTTRLPLLGRGDATCGTCVHHYVDSGHARSFHKCGKVPHTNGPGTDVRVGWPACTAYEVDPHS